MNGCYEGDVGHMDGFYGDGWMLWEWVLEYGWMNPGGG